MSPNYIQQFMSFENNPFKQLQQADDLPSKHQEEVLNAVNTTKFWLEFWDLFTVTQFEITKNALSTIYEAIVDTDNPTLFSSTPKL